MFYVVEVELCLLGTLKVLNDGLPFEYLEVAHMFCNEIYSENSRDMSDYIDLRIIHKKENCKDFNFI